MTKAERIAYARFLKRQQRDDMERANIKRKLDVIGPFRNFLIETGAPDSLRNALDDWVEDLSGDRTYFWSRNYSGTSPRILLKHERTGSK